MKSKIKDLTSRGNGISNELRAMRLRRYIMGWINYFKIADMKQLLSVTDEWMRRRIRMIYWKQWKRVRTKFKMLQSLGVHKQKAWEYANTRKGYWRTSHRQSYPNLLETMSLKGLGSYSFRSIIDRSQQTEEPPYTERYARVVWEVGCSNNEQPLTRFRDFQKKISGFSFTFSLSPCLTNQRYFLPILAASIIGSKTGEKVASRTDRKNIINGHLVVDGGRKHINSLNAVKRSRQLGAQNFPVGFIQNND